MSTLDTAVFLWINATPASPSWLVPFARFVTLKVLEWIFVGSVAVLFVGNARVARCVVRIWLAMLVAALIAHLAQLLFPMPRPFSVGIGTVWRKHADTAGFPSRHACMVFAFAFVVAAYTRRWLPTLGAFGIAGLLAWSRIALGLHFPTDVLAGVAVGGASAWLSSLVPLHRLNLLFANRPAAVAATHPGRR